MTLDQATLKDILDYDPATGIFRWKRNQRRARAGAVAGCCCGESRHVIKIDSVIYTTHCLAWLYMTGEWPAAIVRHQNGDRADNRWINLYAVDWSESKAGRFRQRKAG